MKVALLADKLVGSRILDYFLASYPEDLGAVVTPEDNATYTKAINAGHRAAICNSSQETIAFLSGEGFDLGILAWWPRIIPQPLLEVPSGGWINFHPSLLPHNRGKNYNFWAIIEEAPFGVTLHYADRGIDTGDIIAQQTIAYDWTDTGGTLHEKATAEIVELFARTYPNLRLGTCPRTPQPQGAGSHHISGEMEEKSAIALDQTYTARALLNLLRARTFAGFPACSFTEKDGTEYEIRVQITRKE